MGESGLLEKVSGVTLSLPGTCLTLNLYIIDFNLKFIILGLGMSTRFCLLPNIANNGLWSTQRMRFLRPRTKNLHFSRPVMNQSRGEASVLGSQAYLPLGTENPSLFCVPILTKLGHTNTNVPGKHKRPISFIILFHTPLGVHK